MIKEIEYDRASNNNWLYRKPIEIHGTKGWTINECLELVECSLKIKNNNSYNYHNNYDDSEDHVYATYHDGRYKRENVNGCWFTQNYAEAKKLHDEVVKSAILQLENEIERLKLKSDKS